MTRIAILSDTHDTTDNTRSVVEEIREHSPKLVIHCGDITSPDTLELFTDLPPLECVFGNCDFDKEGLREAAEKLGISPPDYVKELSFEGKKIAVLHGDNPTTLAHMIESQEFDYVFHGHTHEKKDILVGRTRVINPGAFTRVERVSYVILDLEQDTVQFYEGKDQD